MNSSPIQMDSIIQVTDHPISHILFVYTSYLIGRCLLTVAPVSVITEATINAKILPLFSSIEKYNAELYLLSHESCCVKNEMKLY